MSDIITFVFVIWLQGSLGYLAPHALSYEFKEYCEEDRLKFASWGFTVSSECKQRDPPPSKFTLPNSA